jgi:hypothetical protein
MPSQPGAANFPRNCSVTAAGSAKWARTTRLSRSVSRNLPFRAAAPALRQADIHRPEDSKMYGVRARKAYRLGMTWEQDLQLYFKRAKASEVDFGDAPWHPERVAPLFAQ